VSTSPPPSPDQDILRRLEKEKVLVFTPSRRVQGRRVVCYDDRFIVKLAYESDGVIVSNDNYRDLADEKPEWKKFVDERLLMYSFVNDKYVAAGNMKTSRKRQIFRSFFNRTARSRAVNTYIL